MSQLMKNKFEKSLNEDQLRKLYGDKAPLKQFHDKRLKTRTYFDSGDYALAKAGKGDGVDAGAVGSQHPVPEDIPHASSPSSSQATGINHAHHGSVSSQAGQAGSPIKESSFLHRETSADDAKERKENAQPAPVAEDSPQGIPIRK